MTKKNGVKYCSIGPVAGAPYERFLVLDEGLAVEIVISRPDGEQVERPHGTLRWKKRRDPADIVTRKIDVHGQTLGVIPRAGEQPRKPVWRRAGKRVEGGMT